MNLAFIGTGYVGLVTGACMAELGHTVVCADIDKKKIAKLKRGVMPIYEMGLEDLVEKNVKEGRLSFTTSVKEAVQRSEVVFNAVGTPPHPKTGEADLSYVFAVAESFGKHLNGYKVLVNKSTVPVGTADETRVRVERAARGKHDFDVVSNPEFLREGAAIKDFLNPDRVVVGTASERARKIMEKIYRPLARSGRPIVFTDVRSAEIIKYASNSFLAAKISFINEIATFCEAAGGNVKEVARGMGLDERIGSRFLYAGIGYGGSCFPKDVQALLRTGEQWKTPFRILAAVEAVNRHQKMKPYRLLREELGPLKGKTVAVWGLSFKPRTDDVREAPALELIRALRKDGARVRAFDPVAMENARAALGATGIRYAKTADEAARGADALVVATEWDEFRSAELSRLRELLKGDLIVDGRNIFDRSEAEAAGFNYRGVGV